MLTSQTIKNCLEEMRAITRTQFCVQDLSGNTIAITEDMVPTDRESVSGFAQSNVDSRIIGTSCLLKILDEGDPFYILTAKGNNDYTFMVGKMVASQIQTLIDACKERVDRVNFFQNLLLDNMLLIDIRNRARKLHIPNEEWRAVIIFEVGFRNSVLPPTVADTARERAAMQRLTGYFASQNGDFLTELEENNVVLVKTVGSQQDYETLRQCACDAVTMLTDETGVMVRAGYGAVVDDLRDLSKSYKEARMAMDVGQIFFPDRRVLSYNELGIGRLIYQLPPNLCRMFLKETLGEYEPSRIDTETLATIRTFFDNNLNVSETARKLYIHRNTLVYRMEKLQKTTGLDIRSFEDAMTFRIALMVSEYMMYLDRTNGS